ncbi:hypothetical protein ACHWQZ_G009226 [Mnemiopsis leidyi]
MSDRPFAVGFIFGVLPVLLSYIKGWVWFPSELSWEDKGLMILCAMIVVSNYLNEYLQWYPLQYSKFAPEGGVPARLGWFLLYFIPMVAYVLVWNYLGASTEPYDLLMLGLYCAHFSKRCLETLFVHKYSKDCVLIAVIEIATFYSLGAVTTAYSLHSLSGPERHSFLDNELRVKIGLGVYCTGQLCNLAHHYILASLRSPGKYKYVIPSGGLFSLVVCPQYAGELLSWLGFGIVGMSYGAFINYMPMVAYLSARAHHTYRWYGQKFEDYPGKSTFKLWPFVY